MRIPGLFLLVSLACSAALNDAATQLSRDIFQELIEINTTDSVGSTTARGGGHGQAPDRRGISRRRRSGARRRTIAKATWSRASRYRRPKPMLIIGHLDVVEARREDWTTDPFQFVEKDGYFYGRGTQDMKVDDAILVTTFIRFKA